MGVQDSSGFDRSTASVGGPGALEKVFRTLYDADAAKQLAQLKFEQVPPPTNGPHGMGPSMNEDAARREVSATKARLKQLGTWADDIASTREGSIDKKFFEIGLPMSGKLIEKLELRDLSAYLPEKKAFFVFPLDEVKDYQLSIFNRIPALDFEARLTCDGTFDLAIPGLFNNIVAKKEAAFHLHNHAAFSDSVVFSPGSDLNHCELTFENKTQGKSQRGVIQFVKASERYPALAHFFQPGFEGCLLPVPAKPGPEKFFLSTDFRNFSCPVESEAFEPLPVSIDALQAKVEALLGQRLSTKFLKGNNPYAKLDYSQMPQLDAILISSLVFQSDFTGTILKRLIEEHARRGAMVRIAATEVLTLGKNKAALEDLMAKHPNVRVQFFKWHDVAGSGTGSLIDPVHRVMHLKLFITLSAHHPEHNQVIMGGRNIHDGFAFIKAPDLSRFADLTTYGGNSEAWAPWRDFEVRTRSPELVESLARHLTLFWLRDTKSFSISNIAIALPAKRAQESLQAAKVYARHFLSIPYKDGQQLEEFYAQMFDSAVHSILITSPYFRPTKLIGEALVRASQRGVKIKVVTRLDLKGDSADFILGEVNKQGVNELMGAAQIYEYTVPGEILHTKIVLIDDSLSFVGSVNLNKRSFIHDTESGLLIYNRNFNGDTREMVDGFIAKSRIIDEKLKIVFWKQVLIGILDKDF